MTREKYSDKVKEIMINKNVYGEYHKQNFIRYNYGEMTPINSNIINNMPDNSKIIISQSVYEMLLAVADVTNDSMQEFPFFLYGKEIENNSIEFNEFISASENRQNASASYNETMTKDLEKRIKSNQGKGLVVCHGHSHPLIGNYSENFSLGDFTSYMQMNESNMPFKSKAVELIGCLVTPSADINFVFYDNLTQNFYRFTEVYTRDVDNNLIPVNCYGLNQGENLSR